MELPFVLSRQLGGMASRFNISSISPSDDWSTINLEVPKKITAADYDIMCSGDGLLCFYRVKTFGDGEFVVWNLSTGTCRLLPPSDVTYRPCGCSSKRCEREVYQEGFGLGREVVSESDDFKFVRFMCILNDDDNYDSHNSSCHVDVYSSRNNSWKEHPFPFGFEDKYDISPRLSNEAFICLNGFFYWTTSADVILSFELSSDTFSTLPFPDAPEPVTKFSATRLLELDGSLALVISFKRPGLVGVWVYEGGSTWTRKINLDVRDCDRAVIQPLWFGKKTNDGEYSLLFHGYHGPYDDNACCKICAPRSEALVEYDYARGEFTNIDLIPEDPTTKRIMTMIISRPINVNVNVNVETAKDIDRISSLPDDMILSILSFLSLKEAAASTGLLSKRWSDLWRRSPNLNFQFAHHLLLRDKGKYVECVNSVVGSYRAPALKEFNVSFDLNYSTRRAVARWLEFAFSRRVEVLELNFLGLRRRASLLEKLLRLFKSTNLTSLCLKCLEVSGEAIGMVLRNCPVLERLIIKYAVLTSDLEVCSGSLKRLDVEHCTAGISVSIKGYAPNLTHLKIDSDPLIVITWRPPTLLHYPQLVCSFISSQITTLQFTIKGCLEKGFPEMPSLRVLIVTYQKRRHSIRPITCLLRASPNLEEFEIKHCRRSCSDQQQLGIGMGMDMEGVNNVCHRHRHLRIFKFTWFDVSDGDHLELMSYILENCVALEKIILDIYEADSPKTSLRCAAAMEYAKQLQSELPTHIHLIITFNYRQLI